MHNLATSFSSSSSSSPIETPKQLSPSTSQGSSLHLNLSESLQKLHHSWRKEKKKKKKRKACDTYNKGRYSTTKAQIMFEMVIMYSLQNSRNFWKIPALLILPDSDKCGKIPNWNCPNVKTEGKILNWNSPREKSPTPVCSEYQYFIHSLCFRYFRSPNDWVTSAPTSNIITRFWLLW